MPVRTPVPVVGVIMGSQSDWSVMKAAADTLTELSILFDKNIFSAHRTPDRLYDFAKMAKQNGFLVIIAGAGGAAHLPGMVAALTPLPVIGVPIKSQALSGLDSLYSIVQMPPGVPVGTMAIDGAKNAALYAASILALSDPGLADRLGAYRKTQAESVGRVPRDEEIRS